ncbi:MAG: thiamine phosphate synthase [Gemmatimonadales bacterium]
MITPPPRLHVVTDDRVLGFSDYTQRVRDIARQPGHLALHVRSRARTGRQLVHLVQTTQEAAPGTAVLVNDRVDIALATQAAGVHLPASGLTISAARSILGPRCWIGRSTHSASEAVSALEDGADYVFLGPIRRSASHPEQPAMGLSVLESLRGLRVVAIGGVTAETALSVIEAGAWGIAAISSIWDSPDCGAAVRQMLLSLVT